MSLRRNEILQFNAATVPPFQQQVESMRLGQAELERATELQTRMAPVEEGIWELGEPGAFQELNARDRRQREENLEVLTRQWHRQNPGWDRPNVPEAERWFGWAMTEQRRRQACEQGIRVHCTVQWGTGTPGNPLLMINTALSRASPSYFPSHAPRNPAMPWHVSICRLGDLWRLKEPDTPGGPRHDDRDWRAMTSRVFEEFHNREVWLIPIQYHDNKDTGMRLETPSTTP